MTRLAIVEPLSLLGEAIRDGLRDAAQSWDAVDLLTADTQGVGGVTEVAGQAALVQALDPEGLSQADVVLFCGGEINQKILEALSPDTRAIFIAPPGPVAAATPIVAGVNLDDTVTTNRIISPGTPVIMLGHLLVPLADCGKIQIVAHVLEPASAREQAGLDELFNQTRAILSMSDERPADVFGTQLAFNLLPWQGSHVDLAHELKGVLQRPLEAEILTSQAGVFHSCTVGLYLRIEKDPGLDAVQSLMSQDPLIEVYEQPEYLGPVSAAASDKILLGEVRPSPTTGYWIWMVMDNLVGSTANALAIAKY